MLKVCKRKTRDFSVWCMELTEPARVRLEKPNPRSPVLAMLDSYIDILTQIPTESGGVSIFEDNS